jgi:peptidoglycan-N-acetylmuramic acid deacetylase
MNAKRRVSSEKIAYLTFDAGYENGNVEKILDTLKEKGVVGAFFILKNLIDRNPDLVKRMCTEGHFVCNHTASHRDVSKFKSKDELSVELNVLNEKYKNLTGEDLKKYFRPPEGRFSKESLKFAEELGYKTVFWSFAYADWDNAKQPTPEYAKKKIYDNIHNGCVLLLHPTSSVNAEILGEVIDHMRNEGYTFGTLDDLSLEMGK